jgi:transcriptional regulator with XRE-family HTH domain
MAITLEPTGDVTVRSRRLAVGISQEKLAQLARLSVNTVRNVEAGRRVSAVTTARLDRALARKEAKLDEMPKPRRER